MKKDIEWAKIEIHKELDIWRNVEGGIDGDGINNILNIINQLDEPEVLSQEWIDEHKETIFDLDEDFETEFIKADDLQNLLVPKQDRQKDWAEFTEFLAHERVFSHEDKEYIVVEKPVIPKFVADFIDGKEKWAFFEIFDEDFLFEEHDDVAKWLYDEEELGDAELVLALKCGYEIEEEPKYFVEDNNHTLLCKWESEDGWKVISTIESTEDDLPMEILDFGLTEKEIKDYDPRYWEFRKPVEETE